MGENRKVLGFELMIQIKQKKVYGVENTLPRAPRGILGGTVLIKTHRERGITGLDPSRRGRSPEVPEVRSRSRALLEAEIQSEIVTGYLHYIGFCTV